MKNDEVQRLLGGYATNSLTEAERKELFEAALEDQELFDALQREQALKDLLSDEITRAQVRLALRGGGGSSPRPWLGRWWTWGLAGSAVAVASVAIVLLVNRPEPALNKNVELAMARKPVETDALSASSGGAQSEAAAPAKREGPGDMMRRMARAQMEKRVESKRPAKEEATHLVGDRKDMAAPPPPPPAPAAASPPPAQEPAQLADQNQVQFARQAQTQTGSQQQVQALGTGQPAANAPRDQERAQAATQGQLSAARAGVSGGVGGFVSAPAALKASTLTYSVLKKDETGAYTKVEPSTAVREGDSVRLMVSPSTPGFLNLYERDSKGEWKRLFPPAGIKVNANTPIVVPPQAIDVKDEEQLRLVLSPEPVTMDAAVLNEKTRSKAVEIPPQRGDRGAFVVVDIHLAGKKE